MLASMEEQYIRLPSVIKQEKVNKLNTCIEDGYVTYIRDGVYYNWGTLLFIHLFLNARCVGCVNKIPLKSRKEK